MSEQEGLTHHAPRADSGPRFFFAHHHQHVLVVVVCNPLDFPHIYFSLHFSDRPREHPTRSLDYPYGETHASPPALPLAHRR
jgi:hypothetical protein